MARHRLHLAAAVLPLAAARRRLRHRRLLHGPRPTTGRSTTFATFVEAAHERGMRVIADLVMNHTSSDHPWFQESRLGPDDAEARLVRLVGHRAPLRGRADHLRRHASRRTGRGTRCAAPYFWHRFFSPPARPQLRQPRGRRRRCSTCCASGSTSASTASGSTPSRTSSSARGRTARTSPETHEFLKRVRAEIDAELPRPRAARRGEPVAGGRRRLLRRRRRVPHGVPLPGDAAHVHGAAPGGGARRSSRSSTGRRRSPTTASGASSCATTTS